MPWSEENANSLAIQGVGKSQSQVGSAGYDSASAFEPVGQDELLGVVQGLLHRAGLPMQLDQQVSASINIHCVCSRIEL
jgi:hypothetical protein